MDELRDLLIHVTMKCNNIEETGCGIYNRPEDYIKKKNRNDLIESIRYEIKNLNEALENLRRWEQK